MPHASGWLEGGGVKETEVLVHVIIPANLHFKIGIAVVAEVITTDAVAFGLVIIIVQVEPGAREVVAKAETARDGALINLHTALGRIIGARHGFVPTFVSEFGSIAGSQGHQFRRPGNINLRQGPWRISAKELHASFSRRRAGDEGIGTAVS